MLAYVFSVYEDSQNIREAAIYAVNMRILNVFVILRVESTEKSRMAPLI